MLRRGGSNPLGRTRVKAIYVLVDMAQIGVPISRRPSPPERESDTTMRPGGGAVERPASREGVPARGLKIASRVFAFRFRATQTDIQRELRPTASVSLSGRQALSLQCSRWRGSTVPACGLKVALQIGDWYMLVCTRVSETREPGSTPGSPAM